MNIEEMTEEMLRLSRLIDDGVAMLVRSAREYATAEDEYRLARATAFLAAGGSVGERNATADQKTSKERRAAHLAEGMKQAALEAIRARRAQLSALQSLLASHRAEAEFARTGFE